MVGESLDVVGAGGMGGDLEDTRYAAARADNLAEVLCWCRLLPTPSPRTLEPGLHVPLHSNKENSKQKQRETECGASSTPLYRVWRER